MDSVPKTDFEPTKLVPSQNRNWNRYLETGPSRIHYDSNPKPSYLQPYLQMHRLSIFWVKEMLKSHVFNLVFNLTVGHIFIGHIFIKVKSENCAGGVGIHFNDPKSKDISLEWMGFILNRPNYLYVGPMMEIPPSHMCYGVPM